MRKWTDNEETEAQLLRGIAETLGINTLPYFINDELKILEKPIEINLYIWSYSATTLRLCISDYRPPMGDPDDSRYDLAPTSFFSHSILPPGSLDKDVLIHFIEDSIGKSDIEMDRSYVFMALPWRNTPLKDK